MSTSIDEMIAWHRERAASLCELRTVYPHAVMIRDGLFYAGPSTRTDDYACDDAKDGRTLFWPVSWIGRKGDGGIAITSRRAGTPAEHVASALLRKDPSLFEGL